MIIDRNSSDMTKQAQNTEAAPPSYDAVVNNIAPPGAYVPQGIIPSKDMKVPSPPPFPAAGPSQSIGPTMPPTTVYNYVNPNTHEHVVSLLPPDHPQMRCLQEGAHVPQTRYGLLGIIAAAIWFPLGIGLCLLDRKVRCKRCGMIIDDGMCG